MYSAPYSQVYAKVTLALGEEFLELVNNGPLLGKDYYTIKVRSWSKKGEKADHAAVKEAVQYLNIIFNIKRA